MQRGDVIHRVNRTPVNSRGELVGALNSVKAEKEIVLQVERRGQLSFVTVQFE